MAFWSRVGQENTRRPKRQSNRSTQTRPSPRTQSTPAPDGLAAVSHPTKRCTSLTHFRCRISPRVLRATPRAACFVRTTSHAYICCGGKATSQTNRHIHKQIERHTPQSMNTMDTKISPLQAQHAARAHTSPLTGHGGGGGVGKGVVRKRERGVQRVAEGAAVHGGRALGARGGVGGRRRRLRSARLRQQRRDSNREMSWCAAKPDRCPSDPTPRAC